MKMNYPDYVPIDEQPDHTVENIPEDVLSSAIRIAVTYGECTHCETRQFHPFMPGHNTTWECKSCETEMQIVG